MQPIDGLKLELRVGSCELDPGWTCSVLCRKKAGRSTAASARTGMPRTPKNFIASYILRVCLSWSSKQGIYIAVNNSYTATTPFCLWPDSVGNRYPSTHYSYVWAGAQLWYCTV